MVLKNLFYFFLWILLLPLAYAGEAVPTSDDVELEKRVMSVSGELRCLVCQNQTIADSHAELAIDLRNQVREKLKQGMSEKEIVDFMVKRYGDFVLYRPLVKPSTFLLWFGPLILLVLALVFLVINLRQRRSAMLRESAVLSADEHAKVVSLLSESDNGVKS